MTAPDLIRLFIEPLERLEIPYMITGGVAAVIYGEPRFTRDVDVVLALDSGDVGRLVRAFSRGDLYIPPQEVLKEAAGAPRGGHFNFIHGESGLRADVYVKGDDPLHAWGLERRLRIQVEDVTISVAPVEYVILRKLEYFRDSGSDRHLRDTAMILRVSGDKVDQAELARWVDRLGLGEHFAAASDLRV